MKKTLVPFIFAYAFNLIGFANDGVYMSNGSVIYPIDETEISMEKEILSFTCRNKVSRVDVLFHFNNPGTTTKKLLVGFVTPVAEGDVSAHDRLNSQIDNFMVQHEGEVLPYEIKLSKCEDCELEDYTQERIESGQISHFVYLFEISFHPGLNRVNHSYEVQASSSIFEEQMYDYTLTTGSKWAGSKIKDLTILIDFERDNNFYVSDIFNSTTDWTIIGTGKIANKAISFYDGSIKMVRTISGKLQIQTTNFQPHQNLSFGIISENCFSCVPSESNLSMPLKKALRYHNTIMKFHNQPELTKADLRILRNMIYAQHGYIFKSRELQDYFESFEWYIPDPNVTQETIEFKAGEKEFIEEIIEAENTN